MILYRYNDDGVYYNQETATLDPLENKLHPETGPHYLIPANSTTMAPPVIPEGKQARWLGNAWGYEDKTTPPPTEGERLTSLEAENRLLKAQSQALSAQLDFQEEVITELILTVVP